MELINLEAESKNLDLDGDFKALLEIKKRKHKIPSKLIDVENFTPKNDSALGVVLPSSESSEEINSLYQSLIEAVERDDKKACKGVVEMIHSTGKTLGDPCMRDPKTAATALHVALEKDKKKVANFFIKNRNQQFLMEDFNVVIGKVTSKKTCLHILAETGQTKLMKNLLEKLRPGKQMEDFLEKSVITELKGYRPRFMSAIHLAAFHGHKEMVELLLSHGVDIDINNDQKETPVMWATRANHIDLVRMLINDHEADVNIENTNGSTPLSSAVRNDFADITMVLVKEGNANVDQKRKHGLVFPIFLATVLGHEAIFKILVDADADINGTINGGQTIMHYAAAVDNEAIVEILIKKELDIDKRDDNGNTALMVAVKAGSSSVVHLLIMSKADLSVKNKFGETVWDFAINYEDESIIKQIYKQVRLMFGVERGEKWPGEYPLHVAARKGNVKKVRCLIDLGADPMLEDASGNIFYHYAARENCTEILTEYMNEETVNYGNADDEIPLFLAVQKGHPDAVKILIQKSDVDTTNTNGSTPLHVACGSSLVKSDIVNILVDSIVKPNYWAWFGMDLDEQDESGNTALHIACKKGRADLIEELRDLDPSLTNNEGDTPMHTSAKTGKPDLLAVMLEIFNKPGNMFSIDDLNEEGDTILHICAKRGDTVNVEMLIAAGCDLCVKNKEGNTVLHDLVKQSVMEPSNKDNLVAVYHTITQCAALWWCMKEDLRLPENDTTPYRKIRRTAILYLTSEVTNDKGMNIPVYAASKGSYVMLESILETDGVYKIKSDHDIRYDVTNLAPETVPEKLKKKKVAFYSNVAAVGAAEDGDLAKHAGLSCLDVIIKLDNQVLAAQMLDLHPIKLMVANYWRAYQWIYGLLMLVHIVYMSCYSYYSMPYLAYAASKTSITRFERPNNMALFLLWPIVLLVFEVYYVGASVYGCKRDRPISYFSGFNFLHLPSRVIRWFFNNLDHITLVIFSALIVTWFVLYTTDAGKVTAYVVAMAMVLGWIFTITFVKGFETVHAFSIMLKYIIMRDISRFMVIYIFALLAFAMALHAIVQIVPGVAAAYPSSWDSIFMTFNMMVGMDDLYGGDYEDSFNDAGVNPLFAKIVYIAYIILATIILLNLLIAMMSDTYNGIKQREGTTWRVGSVNLALQIENRMPCFKRCFKGVGVIEDGIEFDPDTHRYMMTLNLKEAHLNEVKEGNELVKAITRMEVKIDQLKSAHNMLQERMDGLEEGQKNLLRRASGQSDPRDRWKRVYQLAVAKAERPVTTRALHAPRASLRPLDTNC